MRVRGETERKIISRPLYGSFAFKIFVFTLSSFNFLKYTQRILRLCTLSTPRNQPWIFIFQFTSAHLSLSLSSTKVLYLRAIGISGHYSHCVISLRAGTRGRIELNFERIESPSRSSEKSLAEKCSCTYIIRMLLQCTQDKASCASKELRNKEGTRAKERIERERAVIVL